MLSYSRFNVQVYSRFNGVYTYDVVVKRSWRDNISESIQDA